MLDQGVFDFGHGSDFKPEHDWNLFFGVLLDEETANRVMRRAKDAAWKHRLNGKVIVPGRLHMSIHGFSGCGDPPSYLVDALARIGSAIAMSPFEVTLRYLLSFGQNRESKEEPSRMPVVLRAESGGLFDLRQGLRTGLGEIGFQTRMFSTPHVTLLYDKTLVPLQPIEPIRFLVKQFALIHSEVGFSRYNILQCWSLKG